MNGDSRAPDAILPSPHGDVGDGRAVTAFERRPERQPIASDAMSILGHRALRREDPALLTTGGTYVDDLDLPDAAFVTYVRATMAHAHLASVDVDEARTMPGVLAVVTAADLDLADLGALMPMYNAAMTRPLLARDTVRFVGEPIVAIVTETRAQGPDAAETVFVDYEPLPALVDPQAATDDEIVLHPDGRHQRGVDAAPLGPRRSTSRTARWWSPRRWSTSAWRRAPSKADRGRRGGKVGDSSSTSPARVRTRSATPSPRCTGSIRREVRVVCPDVGGSFGAKAGSTPELLLLGELSRRVGRPVRWVETRSENMVAMGHGRAQRQEVDPRRHARRPDHRLQARRGAGRRRLPGDGRHPPAT